MATLAPITLRVNVETVRPIGAAKVQPIGDSISVVRLADVPGLPPELARLALVVFARPAPADAREPARVSVVDLADWPADGRRVDVDYVAYTDQGQHAGWIRGLLAAAAELRRRDEP